MRAHSKPVQKSLKMSSKKGSIKVKKPKVSKIKKKDDIKTKGKKLNIKEMTADDFLSGGFEDIDVDNSDVGENSSGSSFSGIIQKETPVKKNKSAKESKQNKKGKYKIMIFFLCMIFQGWKDHIHVTGLGSSMKQKFYYYLEGVGVNFDCWTGYGSFINNSLILFNSDSYWNKITQARAN